MAEDDDSFGDFTFASLPTPQPFPSTTAADDDEDDDDWGDFINHSSNQINGVISKPSDPFPVSHLNHNNAVTVQVQPSPPPPQKPTWNKPNGAIPLSIFGLQEEEEDEKEKEKEEHVFSNDSDSVKKGSGSNGSVGGITDLISNLYNQRSPNGGSVVSISNGSATNLNNLNLDSVEENEDDDDDGWEFKSAEWDSGTKSHNSKAEEKHDNGELGVGSMLDSSTGISDKAGGWNPGFEFYPSSTSQQHVSPQLGQKNESNGSITGFAVFNHNFGELNAHSGSGSNQNLEAPKLANIYTSTVEELRFDGGAPHGSLDPSHESESHQSDKWGFGFDFNSSSLGEDSHMSQSNFNTDINEDDNNKINASLTNTNVDSDVNLFESKGAVAETGTTLESPKIGSENRRAALPLSIFGDEMPDTDEQPVSQDLSPFAPTSPIKSSFSSPGSNLSIKDIWNLYSQTEPKSSASVTPKANENGFHESPGVSGASLVNGDNDFDDGFGDFMDASPGTSFSHEPAQKSSFNHAPQLIENGLQSSPTVLNSDLMNDADGFEDDSWEFKDAFSETRSQDQASAINHIDSPTQLSTKLEPVDYVDFYSKLKDELCNAVLFHFQNLKAAQNVSSISGDDAKATTLQEEIQEFSKILHQDNIIPKEYLSESYSPRNMYFNELLEVLKESKFHIFESESQLASRMSSAEKDMKSAMELLKDTVSTLRILKLGSKEEQSNYLTAWSKIASVCSEELKHGAYIWKQAVQENVHDQILSHPKGVRYIHALGEIYRVAEIIGASVKFHKPWMLGSVDSKSLFSLLNKCYSIWSDSGLEEALFRVSNQNNIDLDANSRGLVESIKYIHELDEHSLQNYAISGEETTCQLSALPAGFLPGLKMVTWNGKHYFVTLANLWVNLISSDPPKK